MSIKLNKSLLAMTVSGLLLSPLAQATNGYFSHGYSTKEKGMAGAGVAYSQDAMAAATNPAGMAFVGERMDVGVQLFSPMRQYTVAGGPSPAPAFGLAPGTHESENEMFLIPHFAYNWQLDSMSAFGVSVYGNGGMNTEYKPTAINPGTFGNGTAGVNLAQLFTNLSYARKLDEDSAYGVSLIMAYQRFEAQGLGCFGGACGFPSFSLDPTKLSQNRKSDSFGFGVKFGYQTALSDKVDVGFSYQSKMYMGEFDEYAGLFAEKGGFDIPSTFTVGVAFDAVNDGKVALDLQKINYTDVAAISNPFMDLLTGCTGPGNTAGCLGGPNGGGFGWEDMTIVKLGYEWGTGDTDWRVGISNGNQPISSSEVVFNILAPAVMETHVTFGMTMPMGKNQELNFAAMYAPTYSVSGVNPLDPAQTITIEMKQYDMQVGWGWKF